MQALISRFGGTPALILKIVFLGVINAAAIWAIPVLISSAELADARDPRGLPSSPSTSS